MSLKAYLYDRKIFFAGGLFCLILTEGVLFLFHSAIAEMIFVGAILCMAIVAYIMLDFRRRSRFYNEVRDVLDRMQEKYLLTEVVDAPDFLEGRLMHDYCREMQKSMNDEIGRHVRLSNAFKSYIETWVHEIKLPIAGAKLMIHNMDFPEDTQGSVRKLKNQLRKIEEDVEQVLYYIRSEVPEKDYVIAGHLLRDIVQEAVKDQKDSLILNHFSVTVDIGDEKVYTDKKWLTFMLRQMMSNSVKYAGNKPGKLHFFCTEKDQSVHLVVEDFGIGICQGDIPRIFEKSFTGENGRGGASTGMGLYICKKLCTELGHKIGAESEVGQYTRIWIEF